VRVRIGFFGGLGVDDGTVAGTMQRALLFRLAIDAGTVVSIRSLVEDLWPDAPPENSRAALQSIVSRLRAQLPSGVIASESGGYRLAVARDDVDVLAFQDLVAAASAEGDPALATRALAEWSGEPWHPEGFEWFEAELLADRARALELGGAVLPPVHELPAALTDLIGREADLALVRSQLAANRVVTIIGPGGAGKTSLALAVARQREHALFVELAPVTDGEVWPAVLGASGRDLRLGEAPTAIGTEERVIGALGGRDLLLVLDNCEHLVAEAAHLVAELLRALPRLRVLATSREPLGVVGEAFVAIGALDRADALELFERRTVAARGHGLDDDERRLASVVCDRLDRLALAIELAAARLRTMTLQELSSGLDDRFTLLASGPRSALPRHQTLWSLIDWSWELLDDDERHALCALSVFPAGVAVNAGLAGQLEKRPDIFDLLVDRSLVQRVQGRFRTLETIREFGIERLAQDGQLESAREHQARFMAEAAIAHDAMLRSARIHEAIAWFDAEEDNMIAALRYAVDVPLPSIAVQLAAASGWYWTVRDRHLDAISWFDQVLPLIGDDESDAAKIVTLMGHLSRAFTGDTAWNDPSVQEQRSRDALAVSEIEPVGAGGHELLQVLAPLLLAFGATLGNESWPYLVDIPNGDELGLDEWPTAILHVMRAALAENRGDIEMEGEASARALEMFEKIGDQWGLALARQIRSEWLSLSGRLEEALAMTDQSSAGMRDITSAQDALQQQGLSLTLLLRLGREDEAQLRVQEMLDAAFADGGSRLIVQARTLAATVALARDDLDTARSHLAHVDELTPDWPAIYPQLLASIELTRGCILLREGRLEESLAAMRASGEVALASGDHPIIAQVALGFGELAVARGELDEAFRALELAAAIRGVLESADPRVAAILAAIGDDRKRELAEASPRPVAVEGLRELLS
jgi:predicted ATPase